VVFVRTDVSEQRFASIIRVKRIKELGTTLALTNNYQLLVTAYFFPCSPILFTLKMESLRSSGK
jgi:hypothetical protein